MLSRVLAYFPQNQDKRIEWVTTFTVYVRIRKEKRAITFDRAREIIQRHFNNCFSAIFSFHLTSFFSII